MDGETLELLHFIDRDNEAWRGFLLDQWQNRNYNCHVLMASVEFSLPEPYKMRQILVLFCF